MRFLTTVKICSALFCYGATEKQNKKNKARIKRIIGGKPETRVSTSIQAINGRAEGERSENLPGATENRKRGPERHKN